MRAKQAPVSNMVRLEMEALCDDCPLRADFIGNDVYATVDGRSLSGAGTEFYIGDGDKLEGFVARGIKRTPDIVKAFNDCEHAISDGIILPDKLVCGAISKLQSRQVK